MKYQFVLIVKGDVPEAIERAKRAGVELRAEPIYTGETTTLVGECTLGPISAWFTEDLYGRAPYPPGSLLSYRFK